MTATCPLPDETAPLEAQMRALANLMDDAMRTARIAVEQYEASVTAEHAVAAAPPANAATTPARRQPDPGSLFIRVARVVQNCILGQSRLLAGLPIARLTAPRASVGEAVNPAPISEDSRPEPVRQALKTVTRNHPHGAKILSAGLENLAATLTAEPRVAANLPSLFRRCCDVTGIRLYPAQWRKAARDLTCEIRAAPA